MTRLEDFLQEWFSADPLLTVHTSGSTGTPKEIRVEKQRMRESARLTCDFLGLQPGDTALLCLPLDYIAGKMMVVRALERDLHLYGITPDSHPLLAENLPDRIDLCAMIPMQVKNSLQTEEERARLAKIRHLIIGGGSIHPTLEKELHTFPNYIWSTYGMTETLSHIALRRVNGPEASLWYTPFDGIGVETDKDDCLVIHAPRLCPEILHTHDRAELRHRGGITEFCILGRTDNVIASGGIKIQMEEVEKMLTPHLTHPFLITKCSDATLGEQVVLLTESPSPETVQTICRNILPRYWQPRKIICVDKIPITPNGKSARAEALQLATRTGWKK